MFAFNVWTLVITSSHCILGSLSFSMSLSALNVLLRELEALCTTGRLGLRLTATQVLSLNKLIARTLETAENCQLSGAGCLELVGCLELAVKIHVDAVHSILDDVLFIAYEMGISGNANLLVALLQARVVRRG